MNTDPITVYLDQLRQIGCETHAESSADTPGDWKIRSSIPGCDPTCEMLISIRVTSGKAEIAHISVAYDELSEGKAATIQSDLPTDSLPDLHSSDQITFAMGAAWHKLRQHRPGMTHQGNLFGDDF